MKRYFILICAAVALVCSCNKYGNAIDDFNNRLDAVENAQATLLTKIEAMEVLANAKAAQVTIDSIKETDAGIQIAFSNGQSYIIKNGEDKISVVDGGTFYTFDFGNGDVISVDMTFSIIFDPETVEVPGGSEAEVKYSFTADDPSIHVTVKPLAGGKVIAVDEDAKVITIQASGRQGENDFLVRAIRNSDGRVCERYFTVISGPRAPIALEGSYSGYYGDTEVAGVDDYYTQFYKGEVDADNYFVGEAYSLLFDFWTPIAEAMAIPAGKFTAADDYAPFTFTRGINVTLREMLEEDLWIYQLFYGISTVEELAEMLGYSVEDLDALQYGSGAELYHQFADETYEDYGVTEGTVEITVSGSQYSVKFDLITIDDEWFFTYDGEIETEDHRPQPHQITDVIVTNYGDWFSEETTNWHIELSDANNPSDGTYIIEVLGEAGQTTLPEGIFEVADDYAPNTVVAGEDFTYWYKSGICWDAADEGSLVIEETADGFYISGEFYDSYYGEDWGFEYRGPVTYDISDNFEVKLGADTGKIKGIHNLDKVDSPQQMKAKANAAKAKKNGTAVKVPFILHK